MNYSDFFPYFNRHMVFKLNNGTEKSGVVLVKTISNIETDKYKTRYKLITTDNMVAWKKAEKENNQERVRRLEGEIDINDIVWAELLNY